MNLYIVLVFKLAVFALFWGKQQTKKKEAINRPQPANMTNKSTPTRTDKI